MKSVVSEIEVPAWKHEQTIREVESKFDLPEEEEGCEVVVQVTGIVRARLDLRDRCNGRAHGVGSVELVVENAHVCGDDAVVGSEESEDRTERE